MKTIFVLTVAVILIAAAVYGYSFAMKDAMNMYPRSKKWADDEAHLDRRRVLLAELAALDQQIADIEALTASECDDTTLKRASELLADAREIRRNVEARLSAAR
jgi:hypothetical protein